MCTECELEFLKSSRANRFLQIEQKQRNNFTESISLIDAS